MKLTFILTTLCLIQVSAATLAQKVTYRQKAANIAIVFEAIGNQTGYEVLCDADLIKTAKLTDVNFQQATIQDVMTAFFPDKDFTFTIRNKTVVVKENEPTFIDNISSRIKSALNLPADITGTVTDTLGNPLVGATVFIKETNVFTYTDSKGNFNFPNISPGKYIMVASYIGYQKSEINVINNGTTLHLEFVLHQGTSKLDQVQIIAYGTQSKRFSVGSYSTVTAEDIEKQPVSNPLLALQGQAPGVNITATSGIPGSQVLVQVRGQNTLNNSITNPLKPYDQPLFIIDGVPFAAQNTNVNQIASLVTSQSYAGGLSQSVGISAFNNIDPADIESITILKDADATSIYGTQGSNGVVLITTKKGKPGPTTFDLNVNTQYNSAADPVQFLNTPQYLQLRKDAFAADGIIPSSDPGNYSAYAPDLTIFDQSKYTNWEKVLYGQNTSNTDVHGSLSGGTLNNTFIMSAGYNRSSYDYPGDFADQRFTFHSNLHHTSVNRRLNIDLTMDYGFDQNNSAGFGGGQDVVLPPNLPDLLGPSGNFIWNYKGFDLTSDQFYASLQQPTNVQNYNLNTAFNISYKLFDGFSIGADLGYNRNTTSEHYIDPASAQNPAGYVDREATFAASNLQTINIEPQIKYNKTIGKNILSAVIGSTYKKNTMYSSQIEGENYPNDNFLGSINGAPTILALDNATLYRYNAGFARFNDIYNSEFIVELTGRRDGSSLFGPDHRFGNFGSVGAGWIFTEEKLLKESLPVLSYGKISGNYGTSGSDGIQGYLYQNLYNTISYIPNFQGISPSAPLNLYNPDYSWALKKSLNIALDLGFFNNRLLLSASYYRDRESDQLVRYPLPIQTGFSSVLGNLDATIQNKGFEFSITSTNVKSKDFTWRTSFNLSLNRNKLISFPNLASSSYNTQYVIGQSTSIVYGYKYKDVNPATGLFEFYKKDGSLTSNPTYGPASQGGDQVPIANGEVKYFGGFGNTFTYKQFSLYIFCQFSSQNALNYLAESYSSYQLGFMYNQPNAVANNYWKAPGDVAQLQRLASSYNTPFIAAAGTNAISSALAFSESSGVYSNDTYLRVKTASLSYQLPNAFLNKMHIKGGSIFINGQNLLTFTNYKVGDPETPGTFTSFPIQRVLAFGLNLKF